MGQDESVAGGQDNGTNRSYFGEVSDLGKIDDKNIEETIRDLQLERLYKKKPELRPKAKNSTSGSVKLKAYISVNVEESFIKKIENVFVLSISLKTECPGLAIIQGNGVFSSRTFPESEKVSIRLPIPPKSMDSFIVEITPTLDKKSVNLKHGFTAVTKHQFLFIKDAESFTLVEQKLTVGSNEYKISINKLIKVVEELISTEECLFCLSEPATDAISECSSHKVLCKKCIEENSAKISYCPYCVKNE